MKRDIGMNLRIWIFWEHEVSSGRDPPGVILGNTVER